jgi:hypothetical protein
MFDDSSRKIQEKMQSGINRVYACDRKLLDSEQIFVDFPRLDEGLRWVTWCCFGMDNTSSNQE